MNPDYDKQYCLIGVYSLFDSTFLKAYQNPRNDFMLLENEINVDNLILILEKLNFQRVKCYSLKNETDLNLEKYFHYICKYTSNYEIIQQNEICDIKERNIIEAILKYQTFTSRCSIINENVENMKTYLEIGIENGFTFNEISIKDKKGVDPDPKINDNRIYKMTSDEFFKFNRETFDVIFIDGMHQSEYFLNDLNNSILCLNNGGLIFVDDVLPINEREQLKIPIKHAYENGILKYREPWTGDVWKVMFYVFINYNKFIKFELFEHSNYRGVGKIEVLKKFQIPSDKKYEIEQYDYNKDFQNYVSMLKKNNEP